MVSNNKAVDNQAAKSDGLRGGGDTESIFNRFESGHDVGV